MEGAIKTCNLSNPLPRSLIPRTEELESLSSVRFGKRFPRSLILISSELKESSIDLTVVKSSLPDRRCRFSSLMRSWINSRPSSSRSNGNDCSEPSSSNMDGSELEPQVLMFEYIMSDTGRISFKTSDAKLHLLSRRDTMRLMTEHAKTERDVKNI